VSLEDFIRANVRTMKRETSPGAPDVSQSLEVVRVARTSIAAFAGIVPGDLLVSVGARHAAKVGTDLNKVEAGERRYQLYSPGSGARLRLEATGVPIGIEVRPSPAAITATYQAAPDPALLPALWDAGKWTMVERLASAELPKPGLISALFRRARRRTPSLLLVGAALYERGERRKGLAMIREYETEAARFFSMEYLAIAHYYDAKERLAARDEDGARTHLQKAYELAPLERVADALAKLTGSRPGRAARFLGKRLPLDYELSGPDGGERVSLAGASTALAPARLLGLVVMGTSRGNAAYDILLRRWLVYATAFREMLAALHVVAESARREADHPEWYKGEDLLHLRGLPITLLHDRSGDVARTVQPPSTPWMFLVDRARVVHLEGGLGDVEIWDALASAERAAAA
jgi:hypothetical protein